MAICLMLPTVITRVLYQLEDRWRELIGWEPAGTAGVPRDARWASEAAVADVGAAEAAAAEAMGAGVAVAGAVGAAAGVRMGAGAAAAVEAAAAERTLYGRTSRSGRNSGDSGGSSDGSGGIGSGGSGGGGTKNRGLHVLLPLFLITLVRDWVAIRELSCNVALCRQFWWFKVCMWVEAGAYTGSHFTST